MIWFLLLLVLSLQSADGAKHALLTSRATSTFGPLLSEPSPILKDLPARSVGPQYELVVLRYAEDLSNWINTIPLLWDVVVLNKGAEYVVNASRCPFTVWLQGNKPESTSNVVATSRCTCRPVEYFHCPQQNDYGREGELMAAYIWQRYKTLAEYTAFCQGDPFVHNAEYLQLLQQPLLLNRVQTMSYMFKENDANRNAIRMHQEYPLFRSETISLRTLDNVYFR